MAADLNLEFTCLTPDDASATGEAAFKQFVIDAREVNPETLPCCTPDRLSSASPASMALWLLPKEIKKLEHALDKES